MKFLNASLFLFLSMLTINPALANRDIMMCQSGLLKIDDQVMALHKAQWPVQFNQLLVNMGLMHESDTPAPQLMDQLEDLYADSYITWRKGGETILIDYDRALDATVSVELDRDASSLWFGLYFFNQDFFQHDPHGLNTFTLMSAQTKWAKPLTVKFEHKEYRQRLMLVAKLSHSEKVMLFELLNDQQELIMVRSDQKEFPITIERFQQRLHSSIQTCNG